MRNMVEARWLVAVRVASIAACHSPSVAARDQRLATSDDFFNRRARGQTHGKRVATRFGSSQTRYPVPSASETPAPSSGARIDRCVGRRPNRAARRPILSPCATDRPTDRAGQPDSALAGRLQMLPRMRGVLQKSLAETRALRCHQSQQRARELQWERRGTGGRAVPRQRAIAWSTPMAVNEMLSLLGMCAVAAGVYRLACWLGCLF